MRAPSPGGMVERHAERLGLEPATLARVKQIVRDSGARDAQLGERIAQARSALRDMVDQDVDQAAVLMQADRVGAVELEARKNRLRAIMDVRAQLTPEQLQELVVIREEGRAQHTSLGSCQSDLRDLCGDSESGPEALACMQGHWSDLSAACQGALTPSDDSGRADDLH